jgi:hypothetical protein
MEPREKVVGRRRADERRTSQEALDWQTSVAEMLRGRGVCRRGVYRFATNAEADTWMMDQLARSAREYQRART